VDRILLRTLTQPRAWAAAGLLLLSAGLLWGAFRHEKPERLPPGWEPVNDRLAASIGDGEVTNGGNAGSSAPAAGSGLADGSPSAAGAADGAPPGAGIAGGSPSGGGVAGGLSPGEGAAGGSTSGAGAAGGSQPGAVAAGETPSDAASGGGFDINRATEAEWDELPGIGPAKARAIVEDRERNGPFRGIDDLARVKGIGPKLLEQIRKAIEARNASGG